MKVDILTLCDFAKDYAGKLTIMGIFDHYTVKKDPLPKSTFYLVAKVILNSEENKQEKEFTTKVIDMATEKPLFGLSGKINPTPSDERSSSNFIFEFSDFQFPSEGDYKFSFKIGDIENSVFLKVHFQE